MKKIITAILILFAINANAQIWQKVGANLTIIDGDTLPVNNAFSKYTSALLKYVKGNVGISTNTHDSVLVFDEFTRSIKKKLVAGGGGTTYTAGYGLNLTGTVFKADSTVVTSIPRLTNTIANYVTLNTSQTITGDKTNTGTLYAFKGSNSAGPTLGSLANVNFSVGQVNNLGLNFGTDLGTGDSWIQAQSNYVAVPFNMKLQPAGGIVTVGDVVGGQPTNVGMLVRGSFGAVDNAKKIIFMTSVPGSQVIAAYDYTANTYLPLNINPEGGINMASAGGNVGIGISSPTAKLDVVGDIKTKHLIGGSSTPTIAGGAGLGTGGTVSVSGTDLGGNITLNIGTSPPGVSSSYAGGTITFATAYTVAPKSVILTPADENSKISEGGGGWYVDLASISTTGFTVYSYNRANAFPSTTMKFFYQVIQ